MWRDPYQTQGLTAPTDVELVTSEFKSLTCAKSQDFSWSKDSQPDWRAQRWPATAELIR